MELFSCIVILLKSKTMQSKGKKILSGFISGEQIPGKELNQLHSWLSENDEEEELFHGEWEEGEVKETELQFSDIQKKLAFKRPANAKPFHKRILIG